MADAILAQSGIYAIRNKINGKQYIGSAVKFSNRFKEHKSKLNRGLHHSKKLQNSWNKRGADAFEFVVIEVVAEKTLLVPREQHWIDHHKAAKDGYNISPTAGSTLGVKASQETREKRSKIMLSLSESMFAARSAAAKGRKFTEEHKAKIGAANKGRKASDEARRKMSEAAKSHPEEVRKARAAARAWYRPSEETKRKVSEKLKGRVMSDEARAKIGAASKGRTHSPETKAKRLATREKNRLAKLAELAE
jgi:group I intron endonuclease